MDGPGRLNGVIDGLGKCDNADCATDAVDAAPVGGAGVVVPFVAVAVVGVGVVLPMLVAGI